MALMVAEYSAMMFAVRLSGYVSTMAIAVGKGDRAIDSGVTAI